MNGPGRRAFCAGALGSALMLGLGPGGREIGCASWAQVFLKYILGHRAMTCVIPGTGRPEYMLDNLGAGRGRMPDGAERKRMADAVARL